MASQDDHQIALEELEIRYTTSITKVIDVLNIYTYIYNPPQAHKQTSLLLSSSSYLPQGLTTTIVKQVQERDGPNALKPPKGTPEYVKFARQLAGGLQCLMWVAASICFIAFGIELSRGNLTSFDDVRS